ncbi:PAS domain S-box-containing protein/diguanylate cyclase (GGDEF) domain-containing protein [Marinobacter daqiaonensis]|uniref:PAS domain S-box-containing protein/diguanylate cyclase (GGDEF) domain-containing protein n=1 Tax=Marinobacter daqiaonensis TaxID=650891 RepID=A0A1I6I493_9GAMM|nr:diguanylate cyclase [Marinobacter daqiaonensis]SFR61479.1 PAS domain S-box-containing protein/diguanylate cyclase (GGDEF) domain-containing protein [Marinobacter daqiaonensis]
MNSNALTKPGLRAILTGVFFFLGAWLGLTQTVTEDGIAILWPANAVLLTALLLTPRREWTGLATAALIAACTAALSVSFPLWSASLFGLVNIFESFLAAFLIRRFCGPGFDFQSLKHLRIFILTGPLVACSVAALLGAAVYNILDRTDNPFWVFWRLWWFADAVGLLLLTPLFASCWHAISTGWRSVRAPHYSKITELVVIWTAIAITGFYAFDFARQGSVEFFLTPVLLLGFVVWTATRFRLLATTATVSIIAVVAVALLIQPLSTYTETIAPQEAIWLTQEYLVVVSIIAVGLSGLIQKIRRQNASLRFQERAIQASNDPISVVDVRQSDMPITWVNPKFEELFGYRAAEIVGQGCQFLQDGDQQKTTIEIIRAAVAESKPCRVQVRNYTKSGKLLWIDLSLAPVSNHAGTVTHYVGIQHDLTQEKEAEERLREANRAIEQQNEVLEEKVQERTQSLNRAVEKLKKVASTDFLTGIANRRHFYEVAKRELKRLKQDGRTAALVAFDLDHFKTINDTFGHEAGDEVLRGVMTPVETTIRPTDLFGRIGGEEFLILLPDTPESAALDIAERIRTQISETPVNYGTTPLQVTASFGIAEWDGSCGLDQLVRQADQALYRAKSEGRNRARA